MNKIIFRKKSFAALLAFSFFGITLLSFGGATFAEKEDGYDRKNEKDDDYQVAVTTTATQSSSSSSSNSGTTTQVIKLPDQIITSVVMQDVILNDADKDGLADENDPHPNIPEYLIVSDVNGNGIDDGYDISI